LYIPITTGLPISRLSALNASARNTGS
jgi:hypothetical protein